MRLLALILCVTLILFATLHSQAQEDQDPYSIAAVRFEIQMRSGEVIARHSFTQKQIVRLGDGISVALAKILDERQMLDPRTLGVILPMIREAFSQPALIAINANKQAQITLLLLDHVRQKVSDRRTSEQIEETITFVKEHAS